MGRGPVSHIKHISILSDSKDMDFEQIRMATGITNGTNIKFVDLRQMNNRIAKIPGIKNSSVRRLSNGDLVIKIENYKVAAQWSDGTNFYPLSVDGVKIDSPSPERNTNTIVFQNVSNDDLKNVNLKEIISTLSPIAKYVDHVNMIESRRWDIHTKNNITIYLPEENPAVAINKISRLNQTHKILSRDIKVIDMRDNSRILVKTRQ